MAVQTNDQQPEKPAPEPPVNLPEKAIPATEPETPTLTQPTETMEVHHHSHGSHSKKTWKSYFWEFLMLFLAVTLYINQLIHTN